MGIQELFECFLGLVVLAIFGMGAYFPYKEWQRVKELAKEHLNTHHTHTALRLTALDAAMIKNMVADNTLTEELPPWSIQNGIVLVACGDGDQSEQFIHTAFQWTSKHRNGQPRVHLQTWNGGSLQLAPPLFGWFKRLEIIVSVLMKGMNHVILSCHAPCGAAYGKKMTVTQVIKELETSLSRMEKLAIRFGLQVNFITCLRVDFGNEEGKKFFWYQSQRARSNQKIRTASGKEALAA